MKLKFLKLLDELVKQISTKIRDIGICTLWDIDLSLRVQNLLEK